jgi:hypothetical protein
LTLAKGVQRLIGSEIDRQVNVQLTIVEEELDRLRMIE